ncbi:MAG: alpha-galactosidase [Verrucomicrobia bacterium]|nr:alpha-galactosidase [Verrucomicrobiota bacterium]
MKTHSFKANGLHLLFAFSEDAPVKLLTFSFSKATKTAPDSRLVKWSRLVEVQANGHDWDDHHGNKYTGTNPAGQLRYQSHRETRTPLGTKLEIVQVGGRLRVTSHLQVIGKLGALRSWTEVVNIGQNPVLLEYVSSAALPGASVGGSGIWDQKMRLHIADNTWGGECQWRSGGLKDFGLSQVYSQAFDTGFSLNRVSISNQGSWSTLGYLPMGALENTETGETLFWQIEHNGSWHWEISDIAKELYVLISGPTFREGHWSKRLARGESFATVPATIGRVKGDLTTALQTLNTVRRLIRLPHPDMEKMPVIFNDYMNCLMAEPTTEKLLPVIDAAAEVGCEYFVVDAGWFATLDETWWTSVGEWEESPDRFPNGGFVRVMDHIRAKGMVPGLWLEMEVVGITSPVARNSPDTWFFQRDGRRVSDHGRYQLDYRNPEVRKYADGILDRVIRDYGIGYIKNDYNINAGPGTDLKADGLGDGLLEHNRAFLAWMDSVMKRHPGLVVENCASGGMRMDYASLCHHSIQSTSDQTDYRLTGIIAAASASAVTPEQSAVWSYPLKNADEEETIFNMVNALLLRIHQSGRIHEIAPRSLALVKEGIGYYKTIRKVIRRGQPIWPLGLARFGAPWASFGIVSGKTTLLAVWRFAGKQRTLDIPFPQLRGKEPQISVGFPAGAAPFWKWNRKTGILSVTLTKEHCARLLRLVDR